MSESHKIRVWNVAIHFTNVCKYREFHYLFYYNYIFITFLLFLLCEKTVSTLDLIEKGILGPSYFWR